MWGGTADRNMVSTMKGLPTTWDVKTKKNIKWVAELGSQTYGNPVVADGYVFVGTNNEAMKDPNIKGDKGILMAFRESDGQFMWQAVHDKLAAGRANDWPFQGVCSSPLVENGIVYYVSNRGEVMAVDADGFRDKTNDGLVKDEKLTREIDADVIWRYDMMEELGVMQHNMANSSPVVFENLIYVSTSNGQDESHVNVPSPQGAGDHRDRQDDRQAGVGGQPGRREDPARPVVVAGGRQDRRRDAGRHRPGRRLRARLRGEVRQAAVGVRPQPEGLGLAEDPQRSHQHAGHRRERRLHRQRTGSGARRRRRPPLRDRPDQARRHHQDREIWHYGDIRRSISTGAIYNGILFYSDFSGFLHAVDIKTGKPLWKHDMFAAIWGSPMVIDGKVYLGDEDGDVTIIAADQTMKMVAENNMGSSVYSTAVPANGTLFLVNRNQLFAIAESK